MTQVKSLAKNTTFLTVAFTIQKILSFFYFAFVARSIGDENLGKYTFAIAFSSIFVILMDFGLGPVLTREGAKEENKLPQELRAVIGTKIILVIATLVLFFFSLKTYATFKDVPTDTILLTSLASVIIVFDTFAFTFYSVFRAKQNLLFESIGIIIYQILIVTSGVIVLKMHLSLYFVILAIIVGSIFQFTYSLFLVAFKARLRITPLFNVQQMKLMLKISAPFALAGIFFRLSGTVDTVLLHFLALEKHVGWYGVAFKLATALTVIPGAFATGFFPAVSRYLKHEPAKVIQIFEQSMFYLMAISVPITVGVLLIADQIIFILYGPAFEASIISLQIFISGLLFVFLNYPVGNLLNAANRQTRNTVNMGLALLVNVVFNIILIPKYTYIGASIAALISNIVLVLLGLPLVKKIIPFRTKFLLIKLFKISVAGILMGLVLYILEPSFQKNSALPILIFLGIGVYVVFLWLLKGVTRDELASFGRGLIRRTP